MKASQPWHPVILSITLDHLFPPLWWSGRQQSSGNPQARVSYTWWLNCTDGTVCSVACCSQQIVVVRLLLSKFPFSQLLQPTNHLKTAKDYFQHVQGVQGRSYERLLVSEPASNLSSLWLLVQASCKPVRSTFFPFLARDWGIWNTCLSEKETVRLKLFYRISEDHALGGPR